MGTKRPGALLLSFPPNANTPRAPGFLVLHKHNQAGAPQRDPLGERRVGVGEYLDDAH